jgi:hypothetical protein
MRFYNSLEVFDFRIHGSTTFNHLAPTAITLMALRISGARQK